MDAVALASHLRSTHPRLPVCRLGLATRGGTGLTVDDVELALARGINFLNWCGQADGLSAAIARGHRRAWSPAARRDGVRAVRSAHCRRSAGRVGWHPAHLEHRLHRRALLDAPGPLSPAEYDLLAQHGQRVRQYAGLFP